MPYVEPRCTETDKELKQLAAEYRQSTRPIKRRINELKCELNACEDTCASGCQRWRNHDHQSYKYHINRCPKRHRTLHTTPAELRYRLKILNDMHRTTSEIGREAEHYYEWGWYRSEIYTFNCRKRG